MAANENFAQLVSTKLEKEPGIDPVTVIMLIGVIVQVIKLINECKKTSADVKDMAKDEYSKKQLIRACRQSLPYGSKHLSKKVAEKIMESALESTDEDIENVFKEFAAG